MNRKVKIIVVTILISQLLHGQDSLILVKKGVYNLKNQSKSTLAIKFINKYSSPIRFPEHPIFQKMEKGGIIPYGDPDVTYKIEKNLSGKYKGQLEPKYSLTQPDAFIDYRPPMKTILPNDTLRLPLDTNIFNYTLTEGLYRVKYLIRFSRFNNLPNVYTDWIYFRVPKSETPK